MSKREGWSWGTADGPEWLTILGSHWGSPILAATADEAIKPEALNAEWNTDRAALAHVTEVYHPGVASGRAYRVTPGTMRKGDK